MFINNAILNETNLMILKTQGLRMSFIVSNSVRMSMATLRFYLVCLNVATNNPTVLLVFMYCYVLKPYILSICMLFNGKDLIL